MVVPGERDRCVRRWAPVRPQLTPPVHRNAAARQRVGDRGETRVLHLIVLFVAASRSSLDLHRDQRGFDAIEYLLTIAIIAVVVVGSVAVGLPQLLITPIINATNTTVAGCAAAGAC